MPSENAIRLENAIVISLPADTIPQESEIRDLAEMLRRIPQYAVDDEDEFQAVLRRIHARQQIGMDVGTALVEDYHPWLAARKPEIEPYYWDRFSKLLVRQKWPGPVITALDKVTDEILDLLGDPDQRGTWRRRGLVMGDVQSGKTATYTALTCKAADAGYRLIILLTGTLENLRKQTQGRMDAGFVGLDSSGWLAKVRNASEVGVGEIDRRKMAVVFTSKARDFNSNLVNQLNLRIRDMPQPILLVVKKNKKILENLENWLRAYNAGPDRVIDVPMLLIDDEADNASINTNPTDGTPTPINERIRALIHLFTRSSYVGFTATPFANIFIHPDKEDEMERHDLFPRDFIYALKAPTNYVGAKQIFDEESDLDCLRVIDDADRIFPPTQRSAYLVEELPSSLSESLRTFILANAIRDLRGEGRTHRSMLVNVSRFTDVQDQVAQLLEHELRQIQQDIRNYSRLPEDQALRNSSIAALKDTWEREYSTTGTDWPSVQAALVNAALPIVVKAVNQKSGRAGLDFSANEQNGLRVVAVGGNSLSRGLTLEGLCVSYFFRNSQMYDTLLQMGRWFGYRDGYGDLCRISLTDEAISWYAHISGASEELRNLVGIMRDIGQTPKDFGLRVRAHPDSLLVTAKNKMRTAAEVERVISVSNEGPETAQLRLGKDHIEANALAAEQFIHGLTDAGIQRSVSPWGNTIWRSVPKSHISALLRRFVSHPLDIVFHYDFLAKFLDETHGTCLDTWDVVVPNGDAEEIEFAGIRCRPQERKVTVNSAVQSILVSGRSRRVGSRGIEREGLPKEEADRIKAAYLAANSDKKNTPDSEYRRHRTRPLLLLHLLRPINEDSPIDTGGWPLVALGMSFPKFDDSSSSRILYKINLVALKNMLSIEDGDDQEIDDDEF